jgi:hypothetical protein
MNAALRFLATGTESSNSDFYTLEHVLKKVARLFRFRHAPTTLILSCVLIAQMIPFDRDALWWAVTGSNRRPSRCKRDALPAELTARDRTFRWRQDVAPGGRTLGLPRQCRCWRSGGRPGPNYPARRRSGGPAGRRPRLSASALHQTPDSANFVGIKTYLSPLPNRAVARYPGNAG